MLSRGSLPEKLIMLLSNPRIRKAGRLVSSDLRQLQDNLPNAPAFVGALDLAKYAKERHVVPNARCGLADLCATVLGKRLNKNVSERMSTAWEQRKLTEEQIRYAACDAYAPLLLYHALSRLGVPKKLVEFIPHTPILLYNADSTTVIARGRLAAMVHPKSFENINLSASHIIVEILEVYVPAAIISSHKKRSLGSFGSTPFSVICLQSRARSYDPLSTHLPAVSTATSILSVTEPLVAPSDTQIQPQSESITSTTIVTSNGDSVTEDQGDGTGTLLSELEDSENEVHPINPPKAGNQVRDVDQDSETFGRSLLTPLAATNWPLEIRSRVLKDVFHVFNMLRISTTHALRKELAYALRDTLFIPDEEDRAQISAHAATLKPPRTFEQLLVTRPAWVWKRCKRVIPPPEELYPLIEKLFLSYGPLKDCLTQQPLFNRHNWHAAKQILELVRQGFISDPPGIPLYTVMGVDAKAGNLPTYRCFRGTNFTEGGVHTHLRARLPTSGASIRHVNACLSDFVLQHNKKVSSKSDYVTY